MQHWLRKHMDDIACVAELCAGTYELPPEQRESFEMAGTLANGIVKGYRKCSHDNVCKAVSLLCTACLPGFPGEPIRQCAGRRDWLMPCDLMFKLRPSG